MIPEKWFVVRNEENHLILNNWENNQRGSGNAHRNDEGYFFSDKGYSTRKSDARGYIEISFEDFQKYVFNKEVKITYQIF